MYLGNFEKEKVLEVCEKLMLKQSDTSNDSLQDRLENFEANKGAVVGY